MFWKAKAARSLIATAALAFAFHAAFPQGPAGRITFAFNDTPLQTVLDHLTQTTGVHFLYSSNRVETHRRLTLSVQQISLDEVFRRIGEEMNVAFKRQGSYVIVKPAPYALVAYRAAPPPPREDIYRAPSFTPHTVSVAPQPHAALPADNREHTRLPFDNDYLKKYAPTLKLYFDTTLLKRLPPMHTRAINTRTRHRGWFIAAGLVMKDYSVGMEVQAGIRNLYAIISPRWLTTGEGHTAYGLGTSFLLRHNFSLQPTYTYAPVRTQDVVVARMRDVVSQTFYDVSAKHHQINVTLQYALTKNLTVRFGPSLNHLTGRHALQGKMIFAGSPVAAPPAINELYTTRPEGYASVKAFVIRVDGPPPEYTTRKSWIGWDASIALRVNFSDRP